jgi:uncharacterized membrane protein YoaK (UPF0700 family)
MPTRVTMEARAYIHLRLLALAAAAGCIDAASYLGLEQVFTANQTGNTVLLGIALGEGDSHAILRTALSLGGFVAGVVVAAVVLRGVTAGWQPRVNVVLGLEAAVLILAAILWDPVGVIALITVISLAMGLQSTAAQHIGVPGVTTTFVTGTLTRIATRLVDRGRTPPERTPALSWLTYLGGAIAGGALSHWTGDAMTVVVGAALVALSVLPWPGAGRRSRPTR